jgi:hypothetical protein
LDWPNVENQETRALIELPITPPKAARDAIFNFKMVIPTPDFLICNHALPNNSTTQKEMIHALRRNTSALKLQLSHNNAYSQPKTARTALDAIGRTSPSSVELSSFFGDETIKSSRK